MTNGDIQRPHKAYLVFTGTGPLVILTTYDSIMNLRLLSKLAAKGVTKFIAYELSVETVEEKYGRQFNIVCEDLHQSDDLRVLDYNGHRAFNMFKLSELGSPIFWDGE